MASVLVLQHAECEGLGLLEDALVAAGLTHHCAHLYRGDAVPRELGDHTGLIVMGGPMSVYEHARHPHLSEELRLIQKTVAVGRPILGVCLGSQLLAVALGGTVTKGLKKEIGWYPVRLTAEASKDALFSDAPKDFMAFHWHGDVFTLPPGCNPLASSDLTGLQAFSYGQNVYGILFHLEVTASSINKMLEVFHVEIHGEGISATAIQNTSPVHLPALSSVGRSVFSSWAQLVRTASR